MTKEEKIISIIRDMEENIVSKWNKRRTRIDKIDKRTMENLKMVTEMHQEALNPNTSQAYDTEIKIGSRPKDKPI